MTTAKVRTRRTITRSEEWWLVFGDVLALILAWAAALAVLWLIKDDEWRTGLVGWWNGLGPQRLAILILFFGTTIVVFWSRGHYSKRRPFADEIIDIAKVLMVMVVLDAVLAYMTRWQFSRAWFATAWLIGFLTLPAARLAVKRSLISAGRWRRPAAILGSGRNAIEAAKALESEPLMGLEVIALLLPPGTSALSAEISIDGQNVPVHGPNDDVELALDALGYPHVIVALEAEELAPQQKLLEHLSARYPDLSIIPPIKGLPLYGMEITHFFSHEVLMLTARNNLARPFPRLVKRIFDIFGSAFLLVALTPLFVFFIWRIRQSGNHAIFQHERVGQDGKFFQLLKFRTMLPNADEVLANLLEKDPRARAEWEREFKLKDDPRVTPIGEFLRSTSLDELPQLWNVLKGDMSLVGPRPVIEEELERYGDKVSYYLQARPGMTGLWQISGRNNTSYDERVALDTWYVRNWSPWHDFVILFRTIGVVLAKEGAY